MHRFQTTAVHAGRDDFGALCVHAPPLDLSTTYPVADLAVGSASFDALVGGSASAANPIYARLHNPTVARAEQAVAALEGTEACVAFGSGMAAMTAVLLARGQHGRHVLVERPLYGTSDHLLASGLCGLEAEFVKAEEIAARRRPDMTSLRRIRRPTTSASTKAEAAATVAFIRGCIPCVFSLIRSLLIMVTRPARVVGARPRAAPCASAAATVPPESAACGHRQAGDRWNPR